MKSHLSLMIFYAAATAAFFSLLWRDERRARVRLFTIMFGSLLFGAIAVAWAMYRWPR